MSHLRLCRAGKLARQNCARKLQVWHWSNAFCAQQSVDRGWALHDSSSPSPPPTSQKTVFFSTVSQFCTTLLPTQPAGRRVTTNNDDKRVDFPVSATSSSVWASRTYISLCSQVYCFIVAAASWRRRCHYCMVVGAQSATNDDRLSVRQALKSTRCIE